MWTYWSKNRTRVMKSSLDFLFWNGSDFLEINSVISRLSKVKPSYNGKTYNNNRNIIQPILFIIHHNPRNETIIFCLRELTFSSPFFYNMLGNTIIYNPFPPQFIIIQKETSPFAYHIRIQKETFLHPLSIRHKSRSKMMLEFQVPFWVLSSKFLNS